MKLFAKPGRLPIVVAALVVLGIASLVLFHHYRAAAMTEHTIELDVTPDQAAARSAEFLRDIVGQELKRDKTAKSRVLGLIHHSHAAAAQLFNDSVVRDSLVDHG